MSKVTKELKEQWETYKQHSDAFWVRIEAKYHTKQKHHFECRLCGEMITALGAREVDEALDKHEKSHPEYAEWIALSQEFSLTDLPKLLHDHDCVFVKCACICGCQANICVADVPENERNIPMLCDMCSLYQGRGHIEHRLSSE